MIDVTIYVLRISYDELEYGNDNLSHHRTRKGARAAFMKFLENSEEMRGCTITEKTEDDEPFLHAQGTDCTVYVEKVTLTD